MPPLQGHPGPIVPTLAQVLKKSNFHTLAVTSNHILGPQHVPGLGRGFDAFHPPSTPERNAAATNSVFFEWLERNNQHRFFAWIHYFDPHLPYQPPGDYASMYYEGDPHDPHFTSMDKVVFPTGWTEPSSWAYRLIAWLEGVRDFRYAVSQYEGEISYLDAMIGEVLAKLAALGLERKTLVVLTADHGESIDEHGIYFGHFTLHEPSTHVPLIFWAPLVFDGPRVVDTLVMSIDIMPTILDILRVDLPPGQLKGRSLLPLLIGRTRDEPHRYVYAVGDHGSQIMVRSAEWKYIETLAPVRVSPKVAMTKGQRELFHVATDPAETVNLYDSEPERAAELEEALAQWWGTDDSAPPARDTAEPTEYLKALGYVE
jgi:arylsulfatase A-like enzyme